MAKKIIRLKENVLHDIINEAFHRIINESYSNIDWDRVDTIEFECFYDEDDLQDAINDGDIENTTDGINEWMYDNLLFDMTFTDSNGDTLGYMNETQSMMETYGMPEEYIEMVVNTYKENPQLNQTYYVSDIAYEMANRIGNVDDACKRLFETTDEYSKGMHGFVLKDGTIVLMPPGSDHNNITSINGVEDKWQFVEDGNPSILNNNLRVGDTLTYKQQIVIGRMIRCYSDDELFVDFLGGPKGEQTCRYIYPSYQRVFADIDRYYEEGIIPQGDGF